LQRPDRVNKSQRRKPEYRSFQSPFLSERGVFFETK